MGINTLVLPAPSLSFLLDRLLQYENVDEDSSGERGHEKLVEDMLLALQQASWALPLGRGGQYSLQWFLSQVACPPPHYSFTQV